MKSDLDTLRSHLMNPWNEISALQRRMDRLFEEFAPRSPATVDNGGVDFLPACDLEESSNAFIITVDVPGIPREEIKIEATGDTLTVSGEHREERGSERGKQRFSERYHGKFERTFKLPGMLNAEKIEASYSDGVLNISVPKEKVSQTRQIPVSEGPMKKEVKVSSNRAA